VVVDVVQAGVVVDVVQAAAVDGDADTVVSAIAIASGKGG
jgi:hypothetical protein